MTEPIKCSNMLWSEVFLCTSGCMFKVILLLVDKCPSQVCFRVFLCLAASIVQQSPVNCSLLVQEKHNYSMMQPPPCFMLLFYAAFLLNLLFWSIKFWTNFTRKVFSFSFLFNRSILPFSISSTVNLLFAQLIAVLLRYMKSFWRSLMLGFKPDRSTISITEPIVNLNMYLLRHFNACVCIYHLKWV